MFRLLESHVAGLGAEVCTGFAVQKLCINGDHCTGAIFDVPGRPRTVHADSVIVASGKFSQLLEEVKGKDHVTGATMCVSEELQPKNTEGSIFAKNIFACGSVLTKFASRYENAIDIVSGYQAGMLACQRGVHYARP